MKTKRTLQNTLVQLFVAILLLITTYILYSSFHNANTTKEKRLNELAVAFKQESFQLDSIAAITKKIANQNQDIDSLASQINLLLPDQYHLQIFRNDTLQYWNSNDWSFYNTYNKEWMGNGINRLPNGWYYEKTVHSKEKITLVLSFLIKQEFSYTNKYLNPTFVGAFSELRDINIYSKNTINSSAIYTKDGKVAFYAEYIGIPSLSPFYSILIFLLIFSSLILFFRVILSIVDKKVKNFFLRLILVLGLYLLVFLFFSFFIISKIQIPLFSPYDLALSESINSLGIYFLASVTLFSFVISLNTIIYKWEKNKTTYPIYVALYLICILLWASQCHLLIKGIENSHINPFFSQELKFTLPNLLFALSSVLQFYAFIIAIQTWSLYNEKSWNTKALHYLLCYTIPFVGFLLYPYHLKHYALLVIIYLVTITIQLRTRFEERYKYRFMILFLFAVLGSSMYVIFSKDGLFSRSVEHRKVYTEKIMNERDPNAELLFERISLSITQDSLINDLINGTTTNIEEYLDRRFFSGYWSKYNKSYTIYNVEEELELGATQKWIPADDYFNLLILRRGIQVKDSNFYFLKSMDGRISYLGKFIIKDQYNSYLLIIDLSSKIFDEGKGYPELLLDDRIQKVFNTKSDVFSYARYRNNNIIMQRGKYRYPSRLEELSNGSLANNYDHQYTTINDNITLVVSFKQGSWKDTIVNASYSFILYFTFGVLMIIFVYKHRMPQRAMELKHKIQYAIIVLVLAPLIILAGGIIVYNIIQFRDQNTNDLNRKVQEVTASLQLNFGQTNRLTPETASYIGEELNHLSEILWTDINFFDNNGILATTSRPEIFTQGLIGNRMNRKAYEELRYQHAKTFIHTEHIGTLRYLSIYVPFRNNNEKIIGYINIPYFSRTTDLIKQVTTFIITFINIFVIILLFCLSLAILISQKLTAPLSMIERKMRSMKFGERNEKIQYHTQDEIGKLVERYNEKVDELEKSAKLLAKTEREEAWREMARQIAHEIKNPLTPMKLNIQYLQRMHLDQSDRFDKYFNKVTQSLVEQIDTLSNIATSFSSFAKIPTANIEKVDLHESIKETINLFSSSEVTIIWEDNIKNKMPVLADKEQLGRLFINLIKNGKQAVDDTKESIINITTSIDKSYYVITIKDNGSGIPEEIQDRLFEPYFTTKSQGTGLGLAIVKKIVETFHGEIHFESAKDVGTCFTIHIPKA
ncbi:MAG: HAMP domain-containing histidine kinase [Prolixibacteraceae bacterium]|nr:HAMP domain-containing histidine kinase [Prolixibacteraceae bacterium]